VRKQTTALGDMPLPKGFQSWAEAVKFTGSRLREKWPDLNRRSINIDEVQRSLEAKDLMELDPLGEDEEADYQLNDAVRKQAETWIKMLVGLCDECEVSSKGREAIRSLFAAWIQMSDKAIIEALTRQPKVDQGADGDGSDIEEIIPEQPNDGVPNDEPVADEPVHNQEVQFHYREQYACTYRGIILPPSNEGNEDWETTKRFIAKALNKLIKYRFSESDRTIDQRCWAVIDRATSAKDWIGRWLNSEDQLVREILGPKVRSRQPTVSVLYYFSYNMTMRSSSRQ